MYVLGIEKMSGIYTQDLIDIWYSEGKPNLFQQMFPIISLHDLNPHKWPYLRELEAIMKHEVQQFGGMLLTDLPDLIPFGLKKLVPGFEEKYDEGVEKLRKDCAIEKDDTLEKLLSYWNKTFPRSGGQEWYPPAEGFSDLPTGDDGCYRGPWETFWKLFYDTFPKIGGQEWYPPAEGFDVLSPGNGGEGKKT